MPEYKSNAQKVLGVVINQLKGIEEHVIEKASREIAADLVASNIGRIHNDGKAVDGSDIGEYKEGPYKEKRSEKGRRVDKADLSFTGKLSKEFSFDANGDIVGVGFLTDYGANISEYMEEHFGKTIWGVTQEDERVAGEVAKNRLNEWLKNTR